MKKALSIVLVSLVSFSLAFAGGQGDSKAAAPDKMSGTIIVGGWPSGDKAFQAIIPMFNQKYPNIKVELQFQQSADHHKKLLTALAAGAGAPDVAMVEARYIGMFRDKRGFVNLLDKPYDVKRYEKEFVDYKWQMANSLDGKQMIGLPWDIGPLSMFYRKDIFKDAGLPYEPEDVQKLFSSTEGFLTAARKVYVPGKRWLIGNAADVFMVRKANRDWYNEDLSFRFEDAESLKSLEIAAAIRKEGLDAKVLRNSNEWIAMVKQGQVAVDMSGSWFGGFLKTFIAPETAGKWGIVRVPNVEVPNWGGSFLAIPEQSKNKEAAWAFIEFALATKEAQNAMFKAVDYFPAYKAAWDDPVYQAADPFYDNQKTRLLWIDISKATKPSFVTIMDAQTEAIMRSAISTGLDQGISSKQVLENVKTQILSETAQDRKVMEDLIKKAKGK